MKKLAERFLDWAVADNEAAEGLLGDLYEESGKPPSTLLLLSLAVRFLAVRSRRRRHEKRRRAVSIGQDLSLAFRRLVREPGFATTAVLTLGMGMGASVALFAVVHQVVMDPLPYPNADRLVAIEHRLPGYPVGGEPATFGGFAGQFLLYSERSQEILDLAAFGSFGGALTDENDSEYVKIGWVTPRFFLLLGVSPSLGRGFDPMEPDASVGGRRLSILSHGLWTRRFGADPSVLGRIVGVEGFDREIIGVMPRGFDSPTEKAALWNPRGRDALANSPSSVLPLLIGSLRPGATLDRVEKELNRLIPELPQRFSDEAIRDAVVEGRMVAVVRPLKQWVLGGAATTLWILLAAAGVVLAVAVVNVANLVLVRADAMARELSVRSALGAGEWGLVRFFLAETAIVLGAACLVAVAVAAFGLELLRQVAPRDLPRLDEIRVGFEAVFLPPILSIALTALFTALPRLHGRRDSPALLRGARCSHTTSCSRTRFRHAMVLIQAAMAAMLLCGSGVLLRSFTLLNQVDVGFRSEGLVTFRAPFPFREIREAGPGNDRATRFYSMVAERAGNLPGAEGAAFGECLPLDQTCDLSGVPMAPVDGHLPGAEAPVVVTMRVSSGYHELLGIPLLKGRYLDPSDVDLGGRGVVVSRNLAARFWGDEDPVGKQLKVESFSSSLSAEPLTVIGVVGDVPLVSLREGIQPVVYFPLRAKGFDLEPFVVSYVVRAPHGLGPTLLHREVRSVRPDVPVADVRSMEDIVSDSTHRLRFVLWLVASAAFASLTLTAVGIHGITAYVVRLRRREFGVRVAMGATPAGLRRMVVRQIGFLSGSGLALGLASAVVANRSMESLLFGVKAWDWTTFASVLAFLMGLTIFAAYMPARRAVGDNLVAALSED